MNFDLSFYYGIGIDEAYSRLATARKRPRHGAETMQYRAGTLAGRCRSNVEMQAEHESNAQS